MSLSISMCISCATRWMISSFDSCMLFGPMLMLIALGFSVLTSTCASVRPTYRDSTTLLMSSIVCSSIIVNRDGGNVTIFFPSAGVVDFFSGERDAK